MRGEEHKDGSQLDRLAGPAEVAVLAEVLHLLVWLPATRLENRPDRSGCDDIGANATLNQLLGKGLRIGDDTGLCRGMSSKIGDGW